MSEAEKNSDEPDEEADRGGDPPPNVSSSSFASMEKGGLAEILRTSAAGMRHLQSLGLSFGAQDLVRVGIGAGLSKEQMADLIGIKPMKVEVPASAAMTATFRKWLASSGWGALAGETRSRSRDFQNATTEPSPYSPEMTGPAAYFERHEIVIDSFNALHREITALTKKTAGLPLVWRGVVDASWGLHSKLFRRLMEIKKVRQPGTAPTGAQPFPDEDDLIRAEIRLLSEARSRWRFDGTPALELLAKMQHFGAPTRLLDVSRNPYIAAWFAVERQSKAESEDGRLFAIATTSVGTEPDDQRFSEVVMDESGTDYMPFWHRLSSPELRQEHDWGTGSRRRVWFPPAYEQRIVAQNAGFVIDGVPITSPRTASHFRKTAHGGSYWNRADLLASASIYAKTYDPARTPRSNKANLAPIFTYRITSEAKKDIRSYLERYFDYSSATIYPDIAALSQHLDLNLEEIVSE